MKNTDRFIDIDVSSNTIMGLFVGAENSDEIFKIVKTITNQGNDTHNAQCDHNEDCKGSDYYVRIAYRAYFINHPELNEMERLAITAGIFHMIGNRRSEMVGEVSSSVLRDMLTKNNGGKIPSFKEFMQQLKDKAGIEPKD